jgi:hypothetical protein
MYFNIKIYLSVINCGDLDWTEIGQDRLQRQVVTVIDLWVLSSRETFDRGMSCTCELDDAEQS